VTAGITPKVKVAVEVDAPSGLVTVTFTAPADSGGVVAVIEVEEFTVADAAAVGPKLTVEPGTKFVPVIATEVPPVVDPWFVPSEVTVGTP
jgi:hypothetical protein